MPSWEIRTSAIDPNEFLAHNAPLDDNPIIVSKDYVLFAESRNVTSTISDIANTLAISADTYTISNSFASIGLPLAVNGENYTISNTIGDFGHKYAFSAETYTVTSQVAFIRRIAFQLDSIILLKSGVDEYHLYIKRRVQAPVSRTITSALSKDVRVVYFEAVVEVKTDEYGYITIDKSVEDAFLQVSDAVDEWLAIRDDLNDFLSIGFWPLGSGIYSQTNSHAQLSLDINVSSQIFNITSSFANAFPIIGLKSSTQTITDIFGDLFVLHLRLTRIINPEIQLIFADKYYIEIIFSD